MRLNSKPQLAYKDRINRHDDEAWLIWSNKWGCWYRAKSQGYTDDIARAGIFTKAEASQHFNPDAPKKHRVTEPFPISSVRRHIALCRRDAERGHAARIAKIEALEAALS